MTSPAIKTERSYLITELTGQTPGRRKGIMSIKGKVSKKNRKQFFLSFFGALDASERQKRKYFS